MAKPSTQTTHLWNVIQEWMDAVPYPPSQNKFAKRVGVAGTAISQWKYGQSRPTPENLRALADEMQAVAGPNIYDHLVAAVMADLGYDVPVIRGEGVLTMRVADPQTHEIYVHDQAEPGYEDELVKIRKDRAEHDAVSDPVDTPEPLAADDTPGRDEEAEAPENP